MFTEKRHKLILERLHQEGAVKTLDLVSDLNSSESTIRRDLANLEEMNFLKRVHGGAVLLQSKMSEPSYQDKAQLNNTDKEHIAKYAAALIKDGDSIYLDSGTTIFAMIKHLASKNIMVVTNGVSHVEALMEHQIPFTLVGGRVKPGTKASMGSEALAFLSRYRFDKCFVGANGVHCELGYTTPDPEEGALKGLAIKLSQEPFIVADASKLGEISFMEFAPLEKACLITGAHEKIQDYLDKTRVEVVEG